MPENPYESPEAKIAAPEGTLWEAVFGRIVGVLLALPAVFFAIVSVLLFGALFNGAVFSRALTGGIGFGVISIGLGWLSWRNFKRPAVRQEPEAASEPHA